MVSLRVSVLEKDTTLRLSDVSVKIYTLSKSLIASGTTGYHLFPLGVYASFSVAGNNTYLIEAEKQGYLVQVDTVYIPDNNSYYDMYIQVDQSSPPPRHYSIEMSIHSGKSPYQEISSAKTGEPFMIEVTGYPEGAPIFIEEDLPLLKTKRTDSIMPPSDKALHFWGTWTNPGTAKFKACIDLTTLPDICTEQKTVTITGEPMHCELGDYLVGKCKIPKTYMYLAGGLVALMTLSIITSLVKSSPVYMIPKAIEESAR